MLGVLPRDAGIEIPSRHLGLVPAAERQEAAEAMAQLAQRISDHVSLGSIISVAQSAPPLEAEPWSPADYVQPPSDARPVVAIAAGRAFTFRYAETDELLRAAGCEPVVFDPTSDEQLPAGTAGLYLGGGFPEVHAAELAANDALRLRHPSRDRRRHADSRRVRRAALPVPQRRRAAHGGRYRGRRDHD